MKRYIILLLILIIALLLPSSVAVAKLLHAPHEDPAGAESSIYAPSYLLFYSDVIESLLSGDYQDASALIEQLGYAHIPRELATIIERYNGLVTELSMALSSLEEELDEALSYLEQNRLDEAKASLDEAEALVGEVEGLIEDTEDATEALFERLGQFITPLVEDRAGEAFERLQGMAGRLDELKMGLSQLQGVLGAWAGSQEEQLTPTWLTLEAGATEVFVGQSITISGELTSDGDALPGREVTVFLDGELLATALSGADGSYQAEVGIPWRYVREMSLSSSYIPGGEDRGLYLACQSPQVQIQVIFYQTQLDFTAPAEAYPGLPMTISGDVNSLGTGTSIQRNVLVLLDGIPIAQQVVQGYFEVTIIPGDQTTEGVHILTVSVEPDGLHAGASIDRELNIMKVSPEIQLSAPTITVSPSQIRIDGEAFSEEFGSLGGATVTATLGGASAEAETSADGGFSLTLSPSLNLGAFGPQGLVVTVYPAEPWLSPAEMRMSIFFVNPFILGLMLAAFVSVGVVLYKRRGGAGGVEAVPHEEPLEIAPPPGRAVGFEEVGGVIEAYGRALKAAEDATGVMMKPQVTLREFLSDVAPRLGKAAQAFGELTCLAERALYSPHMPGVEDAARAEGLSHMVEEELKR